jgi:nucleoside-diphosphate-sugar epimerase
MKAFVTGGTGFIGRAVIRKLMERGWEVNALVRSQSGASRLVEMGVHPVWGDITATESMREGMRDCDAVFHIAGWYKLGHRSWRKAELINVEGTRNVLTLAHKLGVPRIIYTSTVAVYGDTHGYNPDESYIPAPCAFLTEYDRTKHLAHYHVAQPLIEQGAPITIVMPGGVYGPGDPSLVGSMMRLFYRGLLPVLPGPEMTVCYAHVDEVAEGHLLAFEKGLIGESYHLTGPALSLRRAVRLWSEVTGKPAPVVNVPPILLRPFAPLVDVLANYMRLPEVISRDAIAILDATYLGKSDKARAELGWSTRPLRDGFRDAFDWIADSEAARPAPLVRLPSTPRQRQAVLLGALLGGLAAMMIWRRR